MLSLYAIQYSISGLLKVFYSIHMQLWMTLKSNKVDPSNGDNQFEKGNFWDTIAARSSTRPLINMGTFLNIRVVRLKRLFCNCENSCISLIPVSWPIVCLSVLTIEEIGGVKGKKKCLPVMQERDGICELFSDLQVQPVWRHQQ